MAEMPNIIEKMKEYSGCLIILLFLQTAFVKAEHLSECDFFYDKRCFEYSDRVVSSREASLACHEIGGTLANIRSRQTMNFLTQLLEDKSQTKENADIVWIGKVFHLDEWMKNKKENEYDSKCGMTLNKKGKVSLQTSVSLFFPCGDHEKHYALCEREGKRCKFRDIHVAHGHISCTSLRTIKPTEKASVTCNRNHVLVGPSQIECLHNGTWTDLPKCVPGCTLSSVPKGVLVINRKSVYDVGEQVTIFCEDGFFPHGPYPMTHLQTICRRDSSWTGSPFTCVPFEKLRYSYSLQAETIVAKPGETKELECALDAYFDTDYIKWTKDQVSIASLEEDEENIQKYVITKKGHLRIFNVTEKNVGRYSCSTYDTDSEEYLSKTYDLQVQKMCPTDTTTVQEVRKPEGDDVLLRCKSASKDANIKWFKDGAIIWGDEKKVITEDGGLLIHQLTLDDAGIYICVVNEESKGCFATNHATLLKLFIVMKSPKSICGLAKIDENDNHGDNSPWFVSLWSADSNKLIGYGTLIDKNWILTSASGVVGIQSPESTNLKVKLGAEKMLPPQTQETVISLVSPDMYSDDFDPTSRRPFGSKKENKITIPIRTNVTRYSKTFTIPKTPLPFNKEVTIDVEVIVLHPEFDSKMHVNDIALLKLKQPVNVTHSARPICLPSKELIDMMDLECNENAPVRQGYTTRLGPINIYQNKTGPVSQSMTILRQARCQQSVQLLLPSSVFCASEFSNIRKPTLLSGDDGSPFDISWDHKTYLWGIHIHRGFHYDFYTAVAPFLPWVQEVTDIE